MQRSYFLGSTQFNQIAGGGGNKTLEIILWRVLDGQDLNPTPVSRSRTVV
jgi:hypothetical protein